MAAIWQKLKEKFIEFLSLTWEKFMIWGGGSEFLKFIKVHQKGFWLNRVISWLVFASSCDFRQQQQKDADVGEHCNIKINVIFP